MDSIRVIYDTNVLVSAAGFGGKPEHCLKIGFRDDVNVFTSPAALDEYRRVLGYDRLPFSENEQQSLPYEFFNLTDATIIEPDVEIAVIEDDPDDNVFLEIAVESDAGYIISGDEHLYELEQFRSTEIVQPAESLTLWARDE